MCDRCDYDQLLSDAGSPVTPHRRKLMEVVGNNPCLLSAQEIFEIIRRSEAINRVTVYRNLDHLVEKGLLVRFSGAKRAALYGIAPNRHHRRHPHFFCRRCGRVDFRLPGSVRVNLEPLERTFPGEIRQVGVFLQGTCPTCLKSRRAVKHRGGLQS